MLTADMSGREIAAVAESLRESNPELAALLTASPTPAILAYVNDVLSGKPSEEPAETPGPVSEETKPKKKRKK